VLAKRPSPAKIVALIALFLSLTGNGLALSGKFTVDSNDLQQGAVRTYAIDKHAVSSTKIATAAVHPRARAVGPLLLLAVSALCLRAAQSSRYGSPPRRST
jgi:hypothetical protein